MNLAHLTDPKPVAKRLDILCGLLSGYLGLTHIAALQRISDGEERRENVRPMGDSLQAEITAATTKIMPFILEYSNQLARTDSLEQDLTHLGESIFEWLLFENRIVAEMVQHESKTPVKKPELRQH